MGLHAALGTALAPWGLPQERGLGPLRHDTETSAPAPGPGAEGEAGKLPGENVETSGQGFPPRPAEGGKDLHCPGTELDQGMSVPVAYWRPGATPEPEPLASSGTKTGSPVRRPGKSQQARHGAGPSMEEQTSDKMPSVAGNRQMPSAAAATRCHAPLERASAGWWHPVPREQRGLLVTEAPWPTSQRYRKSVQTPGLRG